MQMLPPSTPDLASLDLLLSVVRLGSLSRAAASHGISQPSASARIRRMETQLGVQLLTRSPAGAAPTPVGRAVARRAETLVSVAQDLVLAADSFRQLGEAELRVAASYTIAEYLIPGWLATLRKKLPSQIVEVAVVNSTAVLERVQGGHTALGFVESGSALGGVSSAQVGDDQLVLVAAAGHRWTRRRCPLPAAQLASAPVLLREPGSGTREVFEDALRTVGLPPLKATSELGSTSSLKAAVAGGDAVAVLSRLAVEAELADGRLVEVPVAGLDLSRPLRAVWNPTRPLPGPAEELLAIAQA